MATSPDSTAPTNDKIMLSEVDERPKGPDAATQFLLSVHEAHASWPGARVDRPDEQGRHADWPGVGLKKLSGQGAHVPPEMALN